MPQSRSRGPRLWLQPERQRPDGFVERAVWCIRDDGGYKRRTGCGPAERGTAEDMLADYIAAKRSTVRQRDSAANQVMIADVISIYSVDIAPRNSRPKEVAGRLDRLLAWWGDKRLSDVTGKTCRDYVASRSTPAAARRELEDLRAAITHHRREGLCRETVEVVLPAKSPSRIRWMTRSEVARLVITAWRKREIQEGKPTKRYPWRHVARFILLAVYTGTRKSTVCASSFKPREGYGWIDLAHGVWYRRPEDAVETKKRRPPVRLPQHLLAHLRRWSKKQDYPVQWRGGSVLDIDHAFRLVAAEAGLEDVTPHVLRHTATTWLMQAGVDEWEAGGFVGMTPETIKTYAHHHPDYQADALRAMRGQRGQRGQNADKNTRKDHEYSENIVVDLSEKVFKINGQ